MPEAGLGSNKRKMGVSIDEANWAWREMSSDEGSLPTEYHPITSSVGNTCLTVYVMSTCRYLRDLRIKLTLILSRFEKVSVKHVFGARGPATAHVYIFAAHCRGMVDKFERVDDSNLAVTLSAEKRADHCSTTVSRQELISWLMSPYI